MADFDTAARYIDALCGNLEERVTFLALPEGSKRGSAVERYGRLAEFFVELKGLNDKGYGIFACVNRSNGCTHKDSDIVELRALYIDSDSGPIEFTHELPSMRVKTRSGEHLYWLLDRKEDLKRFTEAQKRLALYYKTDTSVSNLGRVMRVPGFYHNKISPYMVTLSVHDALCRPRTIDEILVGVPKIAQVKPAALAVPKVPLTGSDEDKKYGEKALVKACNNIGEAPIGNRHNALVAESRSIGELVVSGCLRGDVAMNEIKSAANRAGLADYEINNAVNWGFNGAKPRKERKVSNDGDRNKISPNEMAKKILDDGNVVQNEAGNIYIYKEDNLWHQVKRERLYTLALDKDSDDDTTKHRREETVSRLLADSRVQVGDVPWNNLNEYEIPVSAGVLNMQTGVIRPHKKTDWLDRILRIKYDKKADCPAWYKCLRDWFKDGIEGAEKIAALQEYFGYILMNHARYKKALILYGESDTGKSVVAGALNGLVGVENCCQIRVSDMDDARKLAPIRGKWLNIIADLPEEALIADGGFKQLVSVGEPVAIDEKYSKVEMYRPNCKHVFVTNNLPNINDKTKATYNRLLIIKFNKVIPSIERDRELSKRLDLELPGILNWAIRGALSLIECLGEFTGIKESEDIIRDYRYEQNPVQMFIDEVFNISGDGYLECNRYPFKNFCREFNVWHGGHPWQPRTIGRSLTAINMARTTINGEWCILGIEKKLSASMHVV